MPAERVLTCMREHRSTWRVFDRMCNRSAFNGYRRTPSKYSLLQCGTCGRTWRTCAGYVANTPDHELVVTAQ